MAENSAQDRTEAPTPRRLEEARKRGQVALSTDLSGAIAVTCSVLVFWISADGIAADILTNVRRQLTVTFPNDLTTREMTALATSAIRFVAGSVALVALAAWISALLSSGLQTGLQITTQPLSPDVSRFSPSKGWSKVWSVRSMSRVALVVLKTVILAAIVIAILRHQRGAIAFAGHTGAVELARVTWRITGYFALSVAAVLLFFGFIDYLVQRWQHESQLRMSRTELKEERRHDEGDPHMRARIKKLQREMGQNRNIQEVSSATVVITNPTHIAVALRYDRQSMAAPRVVAKGQNLWARRIIEQARKHHVPIIERKPLARAIYFAVEPGQEIPADLYRAVAEILAYIYRLRNAA